MVTKRPNISARWRCVSLFLFLLLILLVVSLVIFVTQYDLFRKLTGDNSVSLHHLDSERIEEPLFPHVFHDLTTTECKNIISYLLSKAEFNLTYNDVARPNDSYLYFMELHLPNKSLVLNQGYDVMRIREARAVLIRGDKSPPVVEEYKIGPLHNISSHHLLTSKNHPYPAPYLYRPVTQVEFREILPHLRQIDACLKSLLVESYQARFFDCGKQCLILKYHTNVSPKSSAVEKRLVWFWTHFDVEHYMLHPVDFAILFYLDGTDSSKYKVEKIWYGGQDYTTARELATAHKKKMIKLSQIPFPTDDEELSSLRGSLFTIPFPSQDFENPKIIVKHGQVTYMKWQFYVKMSTQTGPQLFMIKFNDVMIAYEASLQEIATFHSGYHPWIRYSNIIFSSYLLGLHARPLIPGVDCPNHAKYLSTLHQHQCVNATINQNSFCIFEHSTAYPLRRHSSASNNYESYIGMENIVLTVRSIISIFNYDFIIDFVFHSNGVFEIKTSYSGFPLITVDFPQEARYGYTVHNNLVSGIQHTMFNFKIDIDIMGTQNRLKTIDIAEHSIYNGDYSADYGSYFQQLKISEDLKMTEVHSAFVGNSTSPSYVVLYNNAFRSNLQNFFGYRLQVDNEQRQILSSNSGTESSISWARYNIAVTKRKEDESHSSSIYAMWDSKKPVVNFQSFIDDNDCILDEDLVAWVTLLHYDIPSQESFPMLQTTTRKHSAYLTPFHFFEKDPSVSYPDAIRAQVMTRKETCLGN